MEAAVETEEEVVAGSGVDRSETRAVVVVGVEV
jgi:hypothetical protein